MAANPPTLDAALEDVETRFIYNLPESELNSAERLFFQIEQAYWYYEDFKADLYPNLPHFPTLKSFANKIFHHCPLLSSISYQFTELFSDFSQYKSKIPVCGCIMLNPEMTKLVLVCNYGSDSWTFPRGKINENETLFQCAIREVYEETGFDATNHCDEKNFVMSFQGDKKIQLYIAVNVSESTPFQTLARKEISQIAFHPINSIPTNTYHVHPFLPKLKRWIAQRQKTLNMKSPNTNRKKKSNTADTNTGDKAVLRKLKNPFQAIDAKNADTFSSEGKRGWSVDEMFSANAKITGKAYTYDGNPHDFGATHPRYTSYTSLYGDSRPSNAVQGSEEDWLQYAETSLSIHNTLRELQTEGQEMRKILPILQTQASTPHNKRRRFFPPFKLDVKDIMQAVNTQLALHPVK